MKKFWDFKAASDKKGELMIYGDIASSTWWGDEVTPKQFKKELDALGDISALDVYINSSGGDIFAGQAIYSMLKRHDATVTVYVDGLAASIASVIAMAGDKIIMPKGSMMMIHDGMIGLMGYLTAPKLRKYADEIEKITDSVIVPAYERSMQTVDEIKEMMTAETWLSAEDAVEMGFADEIEGEKAVAASISGKVLTINGLDVDIGQFERVPREFLGLVKPPEKPKEEPPQEPKNEKEKLLLTIDLI
jgi:ATP-dependent Clp protease protease subunit